MRPWWWRWRSWPARGPRGGAGASGGPSRVSAGRCHHCRQGGRPPVPHHGAQGRVGGRCRSWPPSSARRADARHLPLHVLIESPAAVHRAFDIAAHPRVQSLSFGLMDFVSAHAGAIPADGMSSAGPVQPPAGGARQAGDRLGLPRARQGALALRGHRVQRRAGHAAPPHAAPRASMGYTRMWSIHPAQIRPILEAFAPDTGEIETATKIIAAAAQADWAPISHGGSCMTGRATVTTGRCWRGRTRPEGRCPTTCGAGSQPRGIDNHTETTP
jgi:hypothetical protein